MTRLVAAGLLLASLAAAGPVLADENRPWAGHGHAGAAAGPAAAGSSLPAQRPAPDPPGTYELPRIAPAPPFALTDAPTGRTVRLADFAGRPLLLSFIYTRCSDPRACPLASRALAAVQAGLPREAASLASVTFDPARDDAAALVAYARAHGADPATWRMLRPPNAGAARRLLEAYDHPVFGQADGSVTHPLRVYLIDAEGVIRQIYSQAYLDPRVILADIETLRLEAAAERR